MQKNIDWPTSQKCPYVFGNEKNKRWWADLANWKRKKKKERGILWRQRPQQKQQHTQNNCKFAVTLGVRPSQAKPSQANPSQAQPTPAQPSSARLSPARNNEINHIYKYKEISKNANWPTSHKCPYVFGNEKNKGWWADLTDWERKKQKKNEVFYGGELQARLLSKLIIS